MITRPVGTGTIVDADDVNGPFWTIGDVSAFAPNFAPVNFNFPVIVSQPFAAAQMVTVNTAGGFITPLVNFVVTMPAGATTVNVPVQVLPNTVPLGNLTFTVTMTLPTAGTLSTKVIGIGTIIDDNATTINIGTAIGFVGKDPIVPSTFNFPVVISNSSPFVTVAGT